MYLNQEQTAQALYHIAYRCAEYSARGCPGSCQFCQLNASLYTNDPAEAALIKTTALNDFTRSKQQYDDERIKTIIPFAIIGVIIIIIIAMCSSGCNADNRFGSSSGCAPQPGIPKDATAGDYVRIAWVVKQRVWDVDNNKKLNCVDYSIVFKKLWDNEYPTNKARLMRNVNASTGMDHLFIGIVLDNGKVQCIEPQEPALQCDMYLSWGAKYNPQFNYNETTHWWQRYGY